MVSKIRENALLVWKNITIEPVVAMYSPHRKLIRITVGIKKFG